MEEIIKEKISADHLLYVSLKYTKTCDVILNLIFRWRIMIERSVDAILYHAKKRKIISKIPVSPIEKIDLMKKLFQKHEIIIKTIEVYEMFRKIDSLRYEREGEFRKNVNLRVFYMGREININMDKLKEYGDLLEKFISYVKQFLSS
ncbi:MAG: hypothetical protein AABY22_26710 [Nanoarchaeota archaeon]